MSINKRIQRSISKNTSYSFWMCAERIYMLSAETVWVRMIVFLSLCGGLKGNQCKTCSVCRSSKVRVIFHNSTARNLDETTQSNFNIELIFFFCYWDCAIWSELESYISDCKNLEPVYLADLHSYGSSFKNFARRTDAGLVK